MKKTCCPVCLRGQSSKHSLDSLDSKDDSNASVKLKGGKGESPGAEDHTSLLGSVKGIFKGGKEKKLQDKYEGGEMDNWKSYEGNAIDIKDLADHINKLKQNNGFIKEHEKIPQAPLKPMTIGLKPQNRERNRYTNMVPYDYNRVKLKATADNPDGYVNASFIDGYKAKSKYVATQGPSSNTIADFWALVWQKKCSKIIMLTNLIEQGQNKCDKYWPDDVDIYGPIKVSRVITKIVADYTLCDFGLTNVETYETRVIRHFRFMAWPDHGVPANPTELLGFYHVIQQHQSKVLGGPCLIHCSAGVGRTGTYIALESMIEMAKDTGMVDVYGFTKEMRHQRIAMLQTPDQYQFLHEALVEALQIGKTFVACSQWADYYNEMEKTREESGKTGVQIQWEIICKIAPTNKIVFDPNNQGFNPVNIKKSRDPKIIPIETKRPKLKITGDGRDGFLSDYINAVFINGFRFNDAFIVTQHPFPNTVVDFWKLVYDYDVYSIVMLNQIDKTNPTGNPYWPQEGTALYASLEVKMEETSAVVTKKYRKSLSIRKLTLANLMKPTEKKRLIRQYHISSWPNNERLPQTTTPILEILERTNEWNELNKARHTIVQDFDGYSRAGIYAVCARLWEQIRAEKGLNIYLSVRAARASRPQFIKEFEDYEFLYKFSADCVDAFDAWKFEVEDIHYIEHYMPVV